LMYRNFGSDVNYQSKWGRGRGGGVAFGGRMVGKNLQLKRVKKFGSFRDYKELANV
jgi:hypothetical protein